MKEKHILGLDIGTNSIGWAVIKASQDDENAAHLHEIVCSGSRIIPMDAAVLGDFDKGNSKSQTADRTMTRSSRRLCERSKLRRERMHRILALSGFLPKHYARQIDRYGKFTAGSEPKLAWSTDDDAQNHPCFIFQQSFHEMLADFCRHQPMLVADGKKVRMEMVAKNRDANVLRQLLESSGLN